MSGFTISQIDGLQVVRDDLITGGTKRRVIDRIFRAEDEYVYASPAAGYAQVALAHGAAAAGKRATIFVARRAQWHARTKEAQAAGATIVQVEHGYLSNVQAKARAYANATGARLLPFGFDCAEVRTALAEIALSLPITPREVWTVAGSGTLTRALQIAWPRAAFHAVQIGKAPTIGRAKLWIAPEKFEENAKEPPPFPSCSNYDAKAWRFIKGNARPGALFWNVAA